MTQLLKIKASLFHNDGQSSRLVDSYAERWLQQHPGAGVIERNLAESPVPHLDQFRFGAFTTPEEERTPEQRAVAAYSDQLIEEIQAADVLVLGIPMYNFSVPSTLSSYFDHIARAGVTFRYTANGPEGLLEGKKAVVFISRGGIYGEDHAQTALVRQFLGFIGISDVEFVHAEGLAAGDDTRAKALATAEARIDELAA
ncbi:FMN-dependent NADH-azoreductase [Microbulbifer yueqingensis]|uniref:FMN dependent NADH:quinone oxidoreductase n=1 Tax=Microbulbifer yueqingensis TaxID=658219 RepID=A0A1G8ZVR5_9GAMM|nr:NAD(P)H-dependent oxidoreductase [Microbulbifer yueqingensis]SDK19067.1 FMN-dependent NADH-azoreductase [Microbulbifer yueqingensis]